MILKPGAIKRLPPGLIGPAGPSSAVSAPGGASPVDSSSIKAPCRSNWFWSRAANWGNRQENSSNWGDSPASSRKRNSPYISSIANSPVSWRFGHRARYDSAGIR